MERPYVRKPYMKHQKLILVVLICLVVVCVLVGCALCTLPEGCDLVRGRRMHAAARNELELETTYENVTGDSKPKQPQLPTYEQAV